jgi:hypothetical protein
MNILELNLHPFAESAHRPDRLGLIYHAAPIAHASLTTVAANACCRFLAHLVRTAAVAAWRWWWG